MSSAQLSNRRSRGGRRRTRFVRLAVPNAVFRRGTFSPWATSGDVTAEAMSRRCGWVRCVGRYAAVLGEGGSIRQMLPLQYRRGNAYKFTFNEGLSIDSYKQRMYMRFYADDEVIAEKTGILVDQGPIGLSGAHALFAHFNDVAPHEGKHIGLEIGVEPSDAAGSDTYGGTTSTGDNEDDTHSGRVPIFAIRLYTQRRIPRRGRYWKI